MNGLIPKRSCVNPVLITTFGLEPLGTKRDEGEGAVARERSDRKGIGETIPQSNRSAVWAQKNEGLYPQLFVPKAGLEPARLFKDIGF